MGNLNRIIMFLDNDKSFLEIRAESLENNGYRVLKAYTLKEAWRILTENYVHLAILDIRAENDDDEKDVSGLTLAKDPAFHSIPKIMLTGFPSVTTVREALGPMLDGMPPAVDYVPKADGPEALTQAIEKAFVQFVNINWQLEIQWNYREPLSFPHLVNVQKSGLTNDNENLVSYANELEDLVRRLFYDYQKLWIGRLLWHVQGRFCLSGRAYSSQGTITSYFLTCGERKLIAEEREQMNQFMPKTRWKIRLENKAETLHYGGIVYILPETDSDIETLQSLRTNFLGGKERILKGTFTHLLGEVLPAWHKYGQEVQENQDLMVPYRQLAGLTDDISHQEEVERRIILLIKAVLPLSAMEITRNNGLIMFHFPHQSLLTYPDPVKAVFEPLIQYSFPIVNKVSPGKLTSDNILIDSDQHAWLTDFIQAGQAPQWWDFICLEAEIRFNLGEAPDLLAWLEFEEYLVAPSQLPERLPDREVTPDLRISITLIEQIKRQAGNETGSNPLPYYAGLLAWVMGAVAADDPGDLHTRADLMRGIHLLLAASMISGRLGKTQISPPLDGGLRLNQDGTVWIGDRRVAVLSGHKKTLLHHLLENKGKILSRRAIMETVFNEPYQDYDEQQESRINSLVKLLREDIEPNPGNPRYLLTVKNEGYRLQVNGKISG